MSLSFSDAAKAKKLREFFAKHSRIYIVVNATGDDVQVPEHFRGDPALRLVLNNRMPQPIYIRDDAVDSDFSFSGQVYSCHIPMHTIWAAYLPDGDLEQGIVWDDDVPEMIRSIVQAVRGMQNQETEESEAAEKGAETPPEDENKPLEGRRVGHLRVIK